MLFTSLHFYTKFVDHQRQIATLVREMAILKADLAEVRGTPSKADAGERAHHST